MKAARRCVCVRVHLAAVPGQLARRQRQNCSHCQNTCTRQASHFAKDEGHLLFGDILSPGPHGQGGREGQMQTRRADANTNRFLLVTKHKSQLILAGLRGRRKKGAVKASANLCK